MDHERETLHVKKQGGDVEDKACCREPVSESDGQEGFSEEQQPREGRTDLRKGKDLS